MTSGDVRSKATVLLLLIHSLLLLLLCGSFVLLNVVLSVFSSRVGVCVKCIFLVVQCVGLRFPLAQTICES